MATEEDIRILSLEIPAVQLRKNIDLTIWYDTDRINGWQFMNLGNPAPGEIDYPYWEGTIDLSGYARDYKTCVPTGGTIQDSSPIATAQMATIIEGPGGPEEVISPSEGFLLYTIASSTPIDAEAVIYELAYGGAPGFIDMGDNSPSSFLPPGSTGTGTKQRTWTSTIFAQAESWCPNRSLEPNSSGLMQRVAITQSGSLSPFASDVLYVVRVVLSYDFLPLRYLSIPASRLVIPSVMTQEEDLVYMMRLQRSIELANQY
jgi:hypothetical protein